MNSIIDPDSDTAVLQQLAYDSNYTEDINVRMRVPETITVKSDRTVGDNQFKGQPPDFFKDGRNAALKMDVPERIVVSVGDRGVQFKEGQARLSSPAEVYGVPSVASVALKTPPRTLTLQEQIFDRDNHKEEEQNGDHTGQLVLGLPDVFNARSPKLCKENIRPPANLEVPSKLERINLHKDDLMIHGLLKNFQNESKNFYHTVMMKLNFNASGNDDKSDTSSGNSVMDNAGFTDEFPLEDLDEVTLMRKQVFKLHKRISVLEKQQADHLRREYIIYGVTAVFWLLNGWFLYSHRRLY